MYKSIGHNVVSLYADAAAIITSNSNLDIAQRQACEIFTKLYHWCVANKLSINSGKHILCCSIWKINRFLKILPVFKQM